MPVIAALVAIGGAVLFAGVAISKAIAQANKIDTDALDASRQVQRQLDRAIPREIVVGTTMTGGVGAFNDAYGSNNEFGVAVTVLSSIPITGWDTLVVDGDRMTIAGDPTTGWRSISSHFLGLNGARRLMCRVWLGDNNASLGVWLNSKFPTKYATTDTFEGCAVLVTVAENTNDDIDDEGENHIPFQSFPVVQAIVHGVAVCDPRNGGVYGDTSTYAFSENAGLIEANLDYGFYGGSAGDELIVGNGFAEGLLDLDRIEATADYCDLRGYKCSGRIRSAAQDDLKEVRKCFNGVRVQSPASVSTIPQGDRPAVVTIDMALYPYAHVTDANRQGFSADVYNKARTLYREPDELYGNKDLPVYTKPEWLTEDNDVPRELDIELKLVPDGDQAFKLQKEIMFIGRAAGSASVVNLPAEFSSDRILPSGCLIQLQNAVPSWLNNVLFTLESKRRESNFDVNIALREYAGDTVFAELNPPDMPTPVISPVLTRLWAGRIGFIFPDGVAGSFIREYNGITYLKDLNIAGRGRTSVELDAITSNIEEAEGGGSGSGGNDPIVISFNNSGNAIYIGPPDNSATSSTLTGTITGGSGSFTYQWAFVSGDSVTINSATSASTTFTTNLQAGDKTAQVRLTVTDTSTNAVKSKNASVTFIDEDQFE